MHSGQDRVKLKLLGLLKWMTICQHAIHDISNVNEVFCENIRNVAVFMMKFCFWR